jgi:hypothetical protein
MCVSVFLVKIGTKITTEISMTAVVNELLEILGDSRLD